MKYKLLRFSLIGIFAMLWGMAFADQVTMKYTGTETTNMTCEGNEAATFGLDADEWSVTGDQGAANNAPGLNKAGDFRLYWHTNGANSITVSSLTGATINTISMTFTGDDYSNVAVTVDGETVTANNGVWAINSSSFVLGNANTRNVQVRIQEVVIDYTPAGGETDTRAASAVTLGQYETTGEAGGTIDLPTFTVNGADGAPIENATVTWTSSNEEVATIGAAAAVINLLKAGTTTIKATFAGDNNFKASSASFKLTVTAAPIDETLTSLKALQEAVTATSTPVTIQFNDVFVTAVKNNNAYLADADGYGVLVYQRDHGLEAGQVLNGTISANLVLYHGQTEITGFSKDGLTITTTELTPTEKTINAITAANQSTLVTLKGVTFSNGKLSDGTNEITYYDNFSAGSLEEGATYDITGIVILFNTTLEIAPRTADDIVKTSADPADERLDLTLSFPQESYEAIMGEDFEEPVLGGVPAEYDGMISYKSSDASVATVSNEGEVTLVGPGTVTITAEAMASQTYKEAEASYTLTVIPAPYTSIAALLEYVTATRTTASYKFDNLLVTYVNGSNTYVNDGEDAFLFYGSDLGLVEGNTYSGIVTGQLYTYNGLPEMSLSADGISAQMTTEGNLIAWPTIAPDALADNINVPVTIEDAVFVGAGSGKNLTFKVGETDLAVYNNWSLDVTALEADKTYTLTGVGSVYAKNETTTYQLYLVSFEEKAEEPEPAGWRDIKIDLTNGNLLEESEKVQWGTINAFGIAVAADGTVSRVAADAENAACVVSGKWHSNSCWASLNVTVNVEGPVKVTSGTQPWSDSPTTIKAGDETVASFSNKGNLWSSTATGNVVSGYYRGPDPTTLTIDGGGYPTYIAIEAIDPADIPNEATLTFETTGVACEGLAPAAKKVEVGTVVTIPANTTLYKEGYTLTAWADASGVSYAPGQEFNVTEDVTLTPVFTENAAAFADRTAETTITWQFGEGNGTGTLNAEGKTTILVAQATIGESVIDVKMDIDATNGKINNVGRGDKWAQCSDNTVLTIPAYKGTAVSFDSYGDAAGTTIGGVEAADKAATYDGEAETLDIVAKGISYIASVTAVYPVPAQEEPGEESVIFSWEGNKDGAIVTGGTVTAVDADGADVTADDVNTTNNGINVIRVRGAKDFSSFVVNIALDKALKAGDQIAITAFRNKNAEGKQSGALLKFENGETTVSTATDGGLEFVNINEAVQGTAEYGTEPNTITLTVPEDADGSKTIAMTRAVTATNLFITKMVITGERSGDEPVEPVIDEDAVVIPSESLDNSKATLVGDRANIASDGHIDWMQPGNTATFKLYNSLDQQAYNISYKVGTPNNGISIQWTLTDATGAPVYDYTQAVTTTGGWDATDQQKVSEPTPELAKGYYTLVLTFQAESGSTTCNVNNIAFTEATAFVSDFTNIYADFTNGSFFTAEENQSVITAGLKMNEDGSFTRVAADDPEANAVITGKFHSNEHGLANFSATVAVEGPVKVSMGTCAWGGDVTIKDATGATVGTFNTNTGACYHNDKQNNIASTYYKGEATTLTISGGSYTPYFAVEAVDPADIPSDCKISFDVANAGAEGVAPADQTVEIGAKFTIPQNFTLYKEGMTLTGWTDGQNTYATGEEITVPEAAELNLLPVFARNTVSLSDRTEEVTVKFDFQRNNGAPSVQWQNQDNLVWVAQAKVNGVTIDVPTHFSTNPGKFNNTNWGDWCQLNDGTTFKIPSCKGATISIQGYNTLGEPASSGSQNVLTIDGQTDYTHNQTVSYTVAGSAETVDVVIGNEGSYYRYIQVVLPVVESQGGQSFDNADMAIEWPMLVDGNVDLNTYTATPTAAISVASFEYSPADATVATGARSKDPDNGLQFVTIMGENVQTHWNVKPAAGLTFTPTQIRLFVQRFGTNKKDGVVVTAKVGDEGEVTTLGTFTARRANWDDSQEEGQWGEVPSNLVNEIVIDLTEAQQAALTSGEGFHLYAVTGLANNKAGGFADCRIYGKVNGTVADVNKYTLAVVAAPEEAGSINVYPKADTYDEGSEVTLTATENFGYDFVNWTNAAGEEVSTEAKFKYTVNSDETITANFVAVETYELALTVDGTNDYMVTINPAPTVIDGKNMYEAGTAVQLTANQYEGLVTFTNWSDGETNSSKLISMTEDIQITAMYAQADIIAGWDFYTVGGNGRKADFAAQDNDADALNLVNTETGETSGWLDKSTVGAGGYESFKGAAVNWRTGASNGDVGHWHWQTKVNAEAFESINVQFQMLYNYNAYQTYLAEYSLDGESWTGFGSVTMNGNRVVGQFNEQLPAEANNQKELYIRMRADKNSSVDGAASANDGNTLAMFFITGTPKLVDDGVAPVLVSTVPENGATGASASGKIVLTFDERVKLADTFMPTATLGNLTLTPKVSGKTVTFEYKGLEYGIEYTFFLPGGSIADLTNNFMQDGITLTFTTMERPSVTKDLYNFVVENVDDLMAAIAAAQSRSDKNTRCRIFIKNGEYTIPLYSTMKTCNGYEVPECITFINTDNVSFIGESRDGVIITNGIPATETFAGQWGEASKYEGIGNGDVFQLRGQGYYWQDLTVQSGIADSRGRNLAIHDRGTQNIYKNVGLRGYQDTWTSNNDNGLYYFEDGYVRGRTDYMCGKGDIFWNRVELRQIAGGYAAVPSKPAKYGWIYKDCTINGEGSGVDGNYTLGRPWGSGTPVALFIDTRMNVVPSAIGWNEMSGGWPARFAEYNSMTSTGSQIDLSGRKKTFGDGHANNPVLTAEEALENSDLHRMYGDWDPTLLTEQAPVPTDVKLDKDTKELTWANSNYALLWAIVKDGKVIDFTTEPKFTVDDVTAAYTVRAANEMGGLSEASATAAITTAISEVANGEQKVPETVYNINGIRVQKAQKGFYIINGRKVVVK